jgi:hypothetical protein
MSMPAYDDAFEKAADRPPFSNGSMWEIWSYRNCERCVNDGMGAGDDELQCPLILVALTGRTPAEWADGNPPLGDYACSLFRECGRGDGTTDEAPPDPEPCQCHRSVAAVSPTHPGHCCFLPATQDCHREEVEAWERWRDRTWGREAGS